MLLDKNKTTLRWTCKKFVMMIPEDIITTYYRCDLNICGILSLSISDTCNITSYLHLVTATQCRCSVHGRSRARLYLFLHLPCLNTCTFKLSLFLTQHI